VNRTMAGAAGLLVLAGALAGACTGSAGSGVPSPSASQALVAPSGPPLPACAEAGTAVAAPTDFPVTFPLPPGAVIVEGGVPAGGGTQIRFVAPIEVVHFGEFLEKELPAAGLAIGGGEAEADELESKFSGQGLEGLLSAREVSGCPGVLRVQVTIRTS
jgi:hypothetical protein